MSRCISNIVLTTEQEIHNMQNFVMQLNSMKESVIVVEGKRDVTALRRVGYLGKVLEFYKFGGMTNFADSVAKFERVIILFDRDRKGRELTRKTIRLLQRRTIVDLSFKRKLRHVSKGKITFTEQLICYESYLR